MQCTQKTASCALGKNAEIIKIHQHVDLSPAFRIKEFIFVTNATCCSRGNASKTSKINSWVATKCGMVSTCFHLRSQGQNIIDVTQNWKLGNHCHAPRGAWWVADGKTIRHALRQDSDNDALKCLYKPVWHSLFVLKDVRFIVNCTGCTFIGGGTN